MINFLTPQTEDVNLFLINKQFLVLFFCYYTNINVFFNIFYDFFVFFTKKSKKNSFFL